DGWAGEFTHDFRRRLTSLARLSLRDLPTSLTLSLLDPNLQPSEGELTAPTPTELGFLLGPYDMKRLGSYVRSLADHHLVSDLLPLLANLRFTGRLVTPLSHVQARLILPAPRLLAAPPLPPYH
ncbi:MAG: hypothetical protein SGPRY_004633, partial [Prymnesium sp.]